jgi:hypothetical protein
MKLVGLRLIRPFILGEALLVRTHGFEFRPGRRKRDSHGLETGQFLDEVFLKNTDLYTTCSGFLYNLLPSRNWRKQWA